MLRCCSVLLLPACLFAQQEIVHYAFDSTDTDQVLNYAGGPNAAPEFGTTSWPANDMYVPGRFGNALQASPYVGVIGRSVHTGWNGNHQGELTIAFFLKNQLANTPTAYSPVTGQPGWSLATGGSAGAGMQLTGWGGPDLNVDFGTAVCSLPGWNHFALVVDSQSATWYLNGAVASTTAISGTVTLGGGELLVGTDYVTFCGSLYHIDEFRMLGRAVTPAEIAAWSSTPAAATTLFGVENGMTVGALGLPTLANATFAIELEAQQSSIWLLVGGTSYANHGAVALPFDLGTVLPGASGSMLRVAPMATAAGVLSGGEATFALPIPNEPLLGAAQVFFQAIGLGESGIEASNGLAVRIGE
jgi:hypothetical protein